MATNKRLRIYRDQLRKLRGTKDLELILPLIEFLSVEGERASLIAQMLSIEGEFINLIVEALSVEVDSDNGIIKMLSVESSAEQNFPLFEALSVEIDIHA